MKSEKELDDEVISLLVNFTHRRISRVVMYFFLCVGSMFSVFAPSEILLQQSSSGLTRVWSVLFAIAAFLCFIGSVTDRWVIEYSMIPLLGSILVVFGVALLGSAYTSNSALIVPYAMFFSAFSFGLVARWRDVQSLLRISVALNGKDRK